MIAFFGDFFGQTSVLGVNKIESKVDSSKDLDFEALFKSLVSDNHLETPSSIYSP